MAAVALFAPATVSAWTAPTITPVCAPDVNSYAFTVTLAHEANYNFDWSFGSSGPWTKVAGQQGPNDLIVPRGQGDLWVRWTSDHNSKSHATPNGALCEQPSSSPSEPVQSETIPPTPTPTLAPTPTPTDPPTPTPTEPPTPTPTLAPTPTPTLAPVPPTFETSCEAVTVSGVTEGWQFIVEPGDLLLTDGQTSLAPGDYTYGLRFMGEDITSGTFTIAACATPTPQPVIVHFLKEVEGGTAQPTDFVMHLTGESSFQGVSGDTIEIPAGTYVLSEDQLPNYFSEFGGGCYQNIAPESLVAAAQGEPVADPSMTFNAGEEWTCGFRNTFAEPTTSPTDPVQSETVPPSATSTPSGSVLNETGKPQITPPATDTVGSTGTTAGDGWRLLLLVGAGLTAALLAVTPSKRRARR
jgi:hypothetical protein